MRALRWRQSNLAAVDRRWIGAEVSLSSRHQMRRRGTGRSIHAETSADPHCPFVTSSSLLGSLPAVAAAAARPDGGRAVVLPSRYQCIQCIWKVILMPMLMPQCSLIPLLLYRRTFQQYNQLVPFSYTIVDYKLAQYFSLTPN